MRKRETKGKNRARKALKTFIFLLPAFLIITAGRNNRTGKTRLALIAAALITAAVLFLLHPRPLMSQSESVKLIRAGQIKQEGSNEEEIARVLSQIEVIGRQANVSLTSLKPSEVIEKEFYKEYIIKVGIKATMIHFVDFVYKLEKPPSLYAWTIFASLPRKRVRR